MSRVLYYVVHDSSLNSGDGILVESLDALRDHLITQTSMADAWMLVLSIHGDVNAIGWRGHYSDAAAIRRIFGTPEFAAWRDAYGPSRIVLNACQVGFDLEQTVIDSLTRPSTRSQTAQGLGRGCRPATEVMVATVERRRRGEDGRLVTYEAEITTREQFNALSPAQRVIVTSNLSGLNQQWGYFGGPNVPAGLILDYYFDEPPHGGWPVVQVSVGDTHELIGVRFSDRLYHAAFQPGGVCRPGEEQVSTHRATTSPTVREGQ